MGPSCVTNTRDLPASGVFDRLIACALAVVACATTGGCGRCGLGLHQSTPWSGDVQPGESVFKDFTLSPQLGEMEIDLSSTSFAATTPGVTDAYLTETSCAKLFDGTYPGAAPLCKVLVGPAATGKVAPPVRLDGGTYRVWVQAYSTNPGAVNFLIDVDLWDNSCRPPLQ